MELKDKLIVALDVEDFDAASRLVESLSSTAGWFKVGSRLFTREGPKVCSLVKSFGSKLFLDLKFHDIPNTVYGAVRSALELEADMITLHTSGGKQMMEAAVKASKDAAKDQSLLLGVTVLTHFKLGDFAELFMSTRSKEEMVMALADAAYESGLDGVVASAREVREIKSRFGSEFKVVTPGIRLAGAEVQDDQERVATPEKAIRDGSDYIVVGRPIIAAPDPVTACNVFLEKIKGA